MKSGMIAAKDLHRGDKVGLKSDGSFTEVVAVDVTEQEVKFYLAGDSQEKTIKPDFPLVIEVHPDNIEDARILQVYDEGLEPLDALDDLTAEEKEQVEELVQAGMKREHLEAMPLDKLQSVLGWMENLRQSLPQEPEISLFMISIEASDHW